LEPVGREYGSRRTPLPGMILSKFKITYHLRGEAVLEQIMDGVAVEAVEAALLQKLSQKHLIFIADGTSGTVGTDGATEADSSIKH
jgi:hypothetical protein